MILSWLFGIILIWINGFESFAFLWLQIKIIFVVILTIYHEYLVNVCVLLKLKENTKSSKFLELLMKFQQFYYFYCIYCSF